MKYSFNGVLRGVFVITHQPGIWLFLGAVVGREVADIYVKRNDKKGALQQFSTEREEQETMEPQSWNQYAALGVELISGLCLVLQLNF